MAISTALQKNNLATAYAAAATHGALYTTVPTATGGTEPTGGSPAYARKPIAWGAASNGVVTGTVTFDVPAGANIQGAGVHNALSGGSFLDGGAITAQSFASQGTFTFTFTYTQS